jgi:hypothetical protein
MKLKLNGGFTVCCHDLYEPLIPILKKIGVNVLFASGATKKKHENIEIVSIPYFTINGTYPANKKDILYSFIGAATHKVRKNLFQMKHDKQTIMIRRDIFHLSQKDLELRKKNAKEYKDILSRSRFALCPRGAGAGSFRLWESLQAGAIPILISDDYLLPPGFNWPTCIIRIKEKDIAKIPELIARIPKDKEEYMRKQCLRAYSLYSGKNFDRVIREYYKDK